MIPPNSDEEKEYIIKLLLKYGKSTKKIEDNPNNP